jgi:hypothetical protein
LIEGWGLLAVAGVWAGAQNALAGGGSFVTLPALMAAGLDARVANLTSTVALFPGQIATAFANRRLVGPVAGLGFGTLLALSLAGGAAGAWLLLRTPTDVFEAMLPWLVLAATLLFARGAFGRPLRAGHLPRPAVAGAQGLVAVYGGYFGGGVGFLLLALFTLGGATVKAAQANKNALTAAANLAGAAVFAASGEVAWGRALVLGLASTLGGYAGARLIAHVPDRIMKGAVIAIGLTLFAALLWRQA